MSTEFYPGQRLDWWHGDNLRIAKVVAVESERVKVAGMTGDYWLSKRALHAKLNRKTKPDTLYERLAGNE
jgi:hypothetical protein